MTTKPPTISNGGFAITSTVATMTSPDYIMCDTSAAIHVCPLWFWNDYPVYEHYYDMSIKKEHHEKKYKSTVSEPYA